MQRKKKRNINPAYKRIANNNIHMHTMYICMDVCKSKVSSHFYQCAERNAKTNYNNEST